MGGDATPRRFGHLAVGLAAGCWLLAASGIDSVILGQVGDFDGVG